MLPTRYATSTCEQTATTTSTCLYEYQPEIYYHDFLTVALFVLFLLSVPVVGYYLNQFHKK